MSARRLRPEEVEFSAMRAQGPGGQHVNTSATAVQLRFDIPASSLPEPVKARLLARADHRRGADGVLVIKAQTARSQALNKAEALARLQQLVDAAWAPPPTRHATAVPRAQRRARQQAKRLRGAVKALRGRPSGGAE